MKRLLIVLSVIGLFSCTVQKRHYQRGYFISWNKHTIEHKDQDKELTRTSALPSVTEASSALKLVKNQSCIEPVVATAAFHKQNNPEDSCDILLFRDGTEIRVKITEISETRIKYTKCSMPGGPLFISNKTEIFKVNYTNGKTEVFKAPETNELKDQPVYFEKQASVKKNTYLATASLIFSILGMYPLIFVGGLVAVICSVIQLNRISAAPDVYGGEGRARIALIIGIVGMILWAMIIAALVIL